MKVDDETLEDTLVRLEELMEIMESLNEKEEDEGELVDLMEKIEDLQYSINAELDTRYEDSYEEDY